MREKESSGSDIAERKTKEKGKIRISNIEIMQIKERRKQKRKKKRT